MSGLALKAARVAFAAVIAVVMLLNVKILGGMLWLLAALVLGTVQMVTGWSPEAKPGDVLAAMRVLEPFVAYPAAVVSFFYVFRIMSTPQVVEVEPRHQSRVDRPQAAHRPNR